MIKYLYDDEIVLNYDNIPCAWRSIMLADQWLLKSFVAKALDEISIQSLNVDSALGFLKYTSFFENHSTFMEKVLRFIMKHLPKIQMKQEYKTLENNQKQLTLLFWKARGCPKNGFGDIVKYLTTHRLSDDVLDLSVNAASQPSLSSSSSSSSSSHSSFSP